MGARTVTFTEGRVERLAYEPCKAGYTLHWDEKQAGLAVRVTKAGVRSYVFERRLKSGDTCRLTIGGVSNWKLGDARAKARALCVDVDNGRDPRVDAAAERAQAEAVRAEAQRTDLVFEGVWRAYIEACSAEWGERHRANHEALAHVGGQR